MKKNKIIILYVLLFVLYPLFMTNGYKNTVMTKCISFALITGVAFFATAWMDYEKYVTENGGLGNFSIKKSIKNLSVTDKFGAAFILAALLSFAFAKYRAVAFTGSSDSYLGLFAVIVMAMIYRTAKKHFSLDEIFVLTASVGGAAAALFAIIQFMGADLFGMFSAIEKTTDRIYNFLSTLGNTSVFGQYMILILPLAVTGYCMADDIRKRIIFGICNSIMIMGIMVANVDAAYLGFIVICALCAVVFLRDAAHFKTIMELCSQTLLSVIILKIIYSLCSSARGRSAITRAIMDVPVYVYVVLMIVFVAAAYLADKKIKSEKFYLAVSKTAKAFSFTIAVAVMALFIYLSVVDTDSQLFGLEKYLRFSDHWGTDRGYVWRWLFTIFMGAGPVQKIFGAGQGSVVFELFSHYKVQMISELKYYFDNAHNVYLHILFTMGILGAAVYIAFIASAVKDGIQKALKENKYMWGAVISIVSYAAVDFFCILQPITLGLYIILIGMVAAKKN